MPSGLFILGPTAVGKSELALSIAQRMGGEIISVDSMQVYRGLDVGTAKPSLSERQRVPHHLVDVVELTEAFDAARFVQLAKTAVEAIQARGKVPVFCGGTGLYFKAYLEGLGAAPPSDPTLRAELEATPLARLLEELARKDPVLYAQIDRQNARRVWRALEVIRLTGRPYSEQRVQWGRAGSAGATAKNGEPAAIVLGIERESGDLHQRINQRVDRMFQNGLVAETEGLLARGLESNRNAMQAIGYRQVVGYLRGELGLAETRELVKQRTRQFARRQRTWFRLQLRVEWLRLAAADELEFVADKACALIGR
jgi:tRNA dimethylallyltransferase